MSKIVEAEFVGVRPPTFFATSHCGLCRLQFPNTRLRFPNTPLQGFDSWEYDFRAGISSRSVFSFSSIDSPTVVCFDRHSESGIGITSPATFVDVLEDIDVAMCGHERIPVVTISRFSPTSESSEPDPTAFCFHDWCYSVLMWRVSNFTKLELYRLTQTLMVAPSTGVDLCLDQGQADPIGSLRTLLSYTVSSSPGLQPQSMSKLPPELRYSIWQYVGLRTAYSSFMLVAVETARLARSLKPSGIRELIVGQGSYLSVKTISAFSTEYIQELYSREASKSECNIPGPVTGLAFAKSLGGICAIKVTGSGWTTGWLGKLPARADDALFGFIPGGVPHLLCSDSVS